jgi:methionyl-tRNA formyltransferase
LVSHINSEETLRFIESLAPDLLIVNGTSIIRGPLLKEYGGRIFNIHVGITPEYRGVHGAFWALHNEEPDLVGVTIHMVDRGIDTGGILKQKQIPVDYSRDSHITLTYKQIRSGAGLMLKAIEKFESGELSAWKKKNVTSRLYFHPGLTDYIRYVRRTGMR